MFQSLVAIQKHPKKANTVKLTKKSAYDKIKKKWTKTGLPFEKGVATFKVGPRVNFRRNIPN